jgi:sulfofructose kinase
MIISELLAHGVDCGNLRRCPGCSSSTSAVIVDARGERMIVNHLDPALPADPSWLPRMDSVGAAAVLADTRWPEGAQAALRAARAAGLPAVLDADRPIPADGELLRAATHVAFSADALADYTGVSDPARGLERAASGLTGWCGVTVGRDGVLAHAGGELRHYPGFEVPVVDTLGGLWALADGKFATAAGPSRAAAAPVAWTKTAGRGERVVLAHTVAEAFVRRVLAEPDAVAVADATSGVLSARRLLVAATLMARRFAAYPEPHVGVMLPASAAADIVFYALHLAGKVPVISLAEMAKRYGG